MFRQMQEQPQQQGPMMQQGQAEQMMAQAAAPQQDQELFDPETTQDALMQAAMLRGMPQEERTKMWPKMASAMLEKKPQLQGLLDPQTPPTDEQLDQLLQPLQDKFRASSVAGEAEGTGVEPLGEKGQPLTAAMKGKIQERLLEGRRELQEMADVYQNWDRDAFTLKGQMEKGVAATKDWLDISSDEDKQLLKRRVDQEQRIQGIMLLRRKFLTGTAGSEKEMQSIEKTLLNKDLTPAQAEAARDRQLYELLRDQVTYSRALERNGGRIPNSEKAIKDYTNIFNEERIQADKLMKGYIGRFKKQYPHATEEQALKYKLYHEGKGQ